MKPRLNFEKDPLEKYLNREKTEKAPEGFTENLMIHIMMEPTHIESGIKVREKNNIPLISLIVTSILILIAVLAGGNEKIEATLPWLQYLNNLKINFPELDFSQVSAHSMPVVLIYIMVSIFFLMILDRILSHYFN